MSYDAYRRSLTPVVRALYRLEVRGQENVPATGPLVVACNHESMLDPIILGAAIPRPMHYLAKSELLRVALIGAWLKSLDVIPVRRGQSDTVAIESAVEVLDAGQVVGIFPEGGVLREGPWLRGAARMALAAGAPLLPVRVSRHGGRSGEGALASRRLRL